MIFRGRQLYLAQTAPSKQQHDCVLSHLPVCGGRASWPCTRALVFSQKIFFKVKEREKKNKKGGRRFFDPAIQRRPCYLN